MVGKEAYRAVIDSTEALDGEIASGDINYRFTMLCNGLAAQDDGQWAFDSINPETISSELKGERVAFYGPNSALAHTPVISANPAELPLYEEAFCQAAVIDCIGKFLEIDPEQAARLSFIFGGIVRHFSEISAHYERRVSGLVAKPVEFLANMTKLGEKRSADAIATAIAMYILSGGSPDKKDQQFVGDIFHMAEAIREDPVNPQDTVELGLSQVARLKRFLVSRGVVESQDLEEITEERQVLEGFPTVGAEWHFPEEALDQYPNFLQRLAILNMSQHQRGSFVQFSRDDQGVVEVRMNPSIYPVTIANWNHMRLLLPELNDAFFTITLNRVESDFNWSEVKDKTLLNKLQALGLLIYAGLFENIPRMGEREQIDFGGSYLGQTVRLNGDKYDFTGLWGGNNGNFGQFAIYAGFGECLPHLAYYLSMVLARRNIAKAVPELLEGIELRDAISLSSRARSQIFDELRGNINNISTLKDASDAGQGIIDKLDPIPLGQS